MLPVASLLGEKTGLTWMEKLSPEGIENTKDRLEALTEINRVYISEGIREENVGYEEGKER